MQIVIDINDEDYKRIQDISDVFNSLTSRTYSAIKNGIQLPKGHGRLIDADRLQDNISHDERQAFTKHQVWLKASIYNPEAPTIIKADKEFNNIKEENPKEPLEESLEKLKDKIYPPIE